MLTNGFGVGVTLAAKAGAAVSTMAAPTPPKAATLLMVLLGLIAPTPSSSAKTNCGSPCVERTAGMLVLVAIHVVPPAPLRASTFVASGQQPEQRSCVRFFRCSDHC